MAIFDKKNEIMAFAHMGWQSTELNLHIKVVNYMIKHYNSNIKDLKVILGPSIKKQSYVLKNPSQLKYDDWKPFLNAIGNDMYEIDLNGYIIAGLYNIGANDITNSIVNTAKNINYFSHFRSTYIDETEKEGRFICGVIMYDSQKR